MLGPLFTCTNVYKISIMHQKYTWHYEDTKCTDDNTLLLESDSYKKKVVTK